MNCKVVTETQMLVVIMKITPENIVSMFEQHGIPRYGLSLNFHPSHNLVRALTYRFHIEFAVVFSIASKCYYLYAGTINSVDLPVHSDEILLNHTHPGGTLKPSIHDINWLKLSQKQGSPQIKSVIIPRASKRITFDINTPTF